MLSVELPCILVAFGILIMSVNIIKYFSLARQLSNVHLKKKGCTQILLFIYILLLIFFWIGYVAIEFLFLFPSLEISHTLVAFIFFFGSVFVFMGIILQTYLSKEVQNSTFTMIQTLINAIEARDANLNGHSQHVEKLTMLIYESLPKRCQISLNKTDLSYAALLHDIGKLGVPEAVLDKKGSLTKEEWELIRKHPLIGKNILSPLQRFHQISDWIYCHHERMDGNGYFGITCDKIPLESRIISVADTFSAITMSRSYREAQSYEKAVAILKECQGSQLDCDVVKVFLKIPKEKVEKCKPKLLNLQ